MKFCTISTLGFRFKNNIQNRKTILNGKLSSHAHILVRLLAFPSHEWLSGSRFKTVIHSVIFHCHRLNMQLLRALYLALFLASFLYFFLYGFLMRKLPKIIISYEEDLSVTRRENFYQRLQGYAQRVRTKDLKPLVKTKLENNSASEALSTSSNLRKSVTKKLFHSTDEDDDITDNVVAGFLSLLGNKEIFELIPTENAVLSKPTRKSVTKHGTGAVLNDLMENIDQLENAEIADKSAPCVQPKRVGRLQVDRQKKLRMEEIQRDLTFVFEGGRWKPSKCLATKVAIVIPFRDRHSHLVFFLNHIHRFLRWQLLDYRIFVIEQSGKDAFNRGMLMNIGFEEAMKREKYDCVIFHDVDLIPEDDRNDYSCPSSPRHMSTAVDTMKYKLGYKKIFGGVEAFWPEHFRIANGFPNRYWGWGGEDDDLYVRVEKTSLGLTRPAQQIGRYFMIKHGGRAINPHRHDMLRESHIYVEKDGLNSLTYEVISQNDNQLYTVIVVKIVPKETDNN